MTFLSHTHQDCHSAQMHRPTLRMMLMVMRQRRALARLDNRALDDLGLTRAQAEAEARRWPWDMD